MKEQFATYEQSLTLKELGFDKPCFGRYQIGGDFVLAHTERYVISNGTDRTKFFILRPLKSQAFEFFREKYGYDVTIKKITKDKYQFIIELICVEDTSYHFVDYYFDSYNEAESSCIDKLIKIVKNK